MGTETRTRIALFALLTIGIVSFAQVVGRGEYVGPALLGLLLALGLTVGLRRVGIGTVPVFGASILALVAYLAIIFQARHTFYGLPGPEAVRRLLKNLTTAWQTGQTDFAPVPPRVGYVIGIVAFTWLAATFGELATFRWRRPLAATIPSIAGLAFVLVVGTRAAAPLLVVVFLALLLTYWAIAASHRLGLWGRWVGPWADRDDVPQGTVAGLIARRMGVSAIALGLLLPIALPSVGEGLLSWRTGLSGSGDGSGDGSGVEIDPFVSIAPRLLQQSGATLFRVRADRPSYWRLVTLSKFDGESWEAVPRALTRIGEADQPIATNATAGQTSTRPLGQDFDLGNLGGRSLPAAAQARYFSLRGRGAIQGALLADVDTGDLSVEDGSVQGVQYSVTSEVPRVTYRQLRDAAVAPPPTPDYLDVPGGLSTDVDQLLDGWIAEARAQTPFEVALAIQDQLLSFEYNEAVEPGASTDYLTQFLLETRAGFCQQFATAFALLARSLGMPTRVAVGFLPGEADPGQQGLYTVRGTDAHAWPEVYFEDFGWISFEPTPRAETARPRYTIAPALLRTALIRHGLTPPRASLLRESVITGGGRDGLSGVTRDLFAQQERRQLPPADPLWAKRFRKLTLALLILSGILLISIPLVKLLLVAARYRRARTPNDLATAAFVEFEEDAADFAQGRGAAESALAFSGRLISARRVAKEPALRLATVYEASQYSAAGAEPGAAQEARGLAREIREGLWRSASWGTRVAGVFSVRRLGLLRHRL
ncbi:MAG: transglutaminaseTgpA domain-containing protein [Actinomycetota bacterium]